VPEDKVIATCYDKSLYSSMIAKILKPDITAADSTALVTAFIDEWIHHQLVLHVAEKNATIYQAIIDEQTKDYKESLTIYLYENELIRNKLDSNVTMEELVTYYDKYQGNYILGTEIVKAIFVKVKNDVIQQDSIRRWMNTWNTENKYNLQAYCDQYAQTCFLNSEEWMTSDQLANKVNNAKIKSQFSSGKLLNTTDSTYTYYIRIFDVKSQGMLAPIAYVKNEIREVIINKRKTEYIKTIYDKIYQDAIKNNDFTINHTSK